MPSAVSFSEEKRYFGQKALHQMVTNSENTVLQVKRLMGRMYKDPVVEEYKKRFNVKVTEHLASGKPQFEVMYKREKKTFLPEQISAMILVELKEIAEEYLGVKVTEAVITAPAYFNAVQREATEEAGRIAGLKVLRIIAEPTAAAIAYGLDDAANMWDHKAMIFDLGGGTFDVSLLELEDSLLNVKATNGDTNLGGEDFKQNMVDHVVQCYQESKNDDLRKYQIQYNILPLACERAKRALSNQEIAEVVINADYVDFSVDFTRSEFENMNMPAFRKCIDLVDQTLQDAEIDKKDITSVVLVGGSIRIPIVQQMLTNYFEDVGKIINTLNPDEAVAFGAAIQAAVLSSGEQGCAQAPILQDITPLSLGIEIAGGRMSVIVPRNKPIPLREKQDYTTTIDNQLAICVKAYQGERAMVADNVFLGEFLVKVPKQEKGVPKVSVNFEINENGILEISAVENSGGTTKKLTIQSDQYKISDNQRKMMIEEAEKMAQEDRIARQKADLSVQLLTSIRNKRAALLGRTDDKSRRQLKVLNDMETWAKENEDEQPQSFRTKIALLEELFE
eukprot:TRINITY_DN6156_c0_g1_i1.p1 TRINITY_DN6156_c0_g1~~TRINITY_DN6156_c0_g1_i1.p1  ORF type:complete len:632 (-),score=88.21 TRINITY_DN6156_c0_g1_i1:162-1850(-)